jgi:nicotinamide-nucleotide amidase
MRAEVVAVGTELLLGQIVDTNSAWIGERLALFGVDCNFQTRVGDNIDRIASALRAALERNEAVIICGGLGPTQDDLTREAIAAVMGVRLRRDSDLIEVIRKRFVPRGPNRTMPANNERQADVPEGAAVIGQTLGTAPGLICTLGDKVMYALPGVPHEMHDMMERAVLPDLQRRSGQASVIRSRTLKTWGYSESGLAERVAAASECPRSPFSQAASKGSRSASQSRPPTIRRRPSRSRPRRPSCAPCSAIRYSPWTTRRWSPPLASCWPNGVGASESLSR